MSSIRYVFLQILNPKINQPNQTLKFVHRKTDKNNAHNLKITCLCSDKNLKYDQIQKNIGLFTVEIKIFYHNKTL